MGKNQENPFPPNETCRPDEPDYAYAFTVFTPSYNRAHTLHRVFNSLEQQTFRDFEWLIIDDGSQDGTADLVRGWQSIAAFPIRYVYQENQGKHIASNHGAKLARGRLFLTLDSDDACVPKALERLAYHWHAIPAEERSQFSAVTVSCVDEYGKPIGSAFPREVTDSDSIEIRLKYKVSGEKWGFHRTAVMREFPFPEIKGEHFVVEGVVWRAIARKYKTRYVNEALRIYHTVAETRAGRLRYETPARKAKGYYRYYVDVLNHDVKAWFFTDPGEFFRAAMNFVRYSCHCKIALGDQWAALRNWPAKMLWLIMSLAGYVRYRLDNHRERATLAAVSQSSLGQ